MTWMKSNSISHKHKSIIRKLCHFYNIFISQWNIPLFWLIDTKGKLKMVLIFWKILTEFYTDQRFLHTNNNLSELKSNLQGRKKWPTFLYEGLISAADKCIFKFLMIPEDCKLYQRQRKCDKKYSFSLL